MHAGKYEGMGMIQCRLRELIAEKRRTDGHRVNYANIMAGTGISTTTLTRLANDRSEKVAISTVNRLCAYFKVQPGYLFIYVEEREKGDRKSVV